MCWVFGEIGEDEGRAFCFSGGKWFSYGDLARAVGAAGERLDVAGVRPGEVVALVGRYGFEAIACLLALAKNRNVVMPLVGGDRRDVSGRIAEIGPDWVIRVEEKEGAGEKRSTFNIQLSTFNWGEATNPSTGSGRAGNPSTGSGRANNQQPPTNNRQPKEGAGEKRSTFNVQLSTFNGGEATNPSVDSGRNNNGLIAGLREAGRAGLILFSSGTVGRPKAMLHDLDRLVENYRPGGPKDLRVLAFMGIDHIGGLDILFRALASKSALVIPEERSPESVCALIEEHRVNVLPATPSFLNLLLLSEAYRERDLSSLEIIGFGAERMPSAVLERLRRVFPGVRYQQKFGTSETNAVRTVSKESDPLWMRIEDPAVEWKIVENELWIRTPSRILGYLNAESDRLAEDGWYRTGDLVEQDGEGFFRIVGRRESMINVGGEKVLPGEVEAVLREVEGVVDCRVFGESNAILGQAVAAEVVCAEGKADERAFVREVRRYCRKQLAPYKVPVAIRLVKEIAVSDRFKRRI